MTNVDVPVSLFDYVHGPDIANAVHAVLGADQNWVDPSLGWDEMRAYHQALLMAAKLRSDLACHLMDCWEAVWGESVSGPRFEELRQDDRNIAKEERYAPAPVWQNATVNRFFWDLEAKKKTVLWTNLRFHLSSRCYDAQFSYGIGNTYHLVETQQWGAFDDECWQTSCHKSAFPDGRGDPVDLSVLSRAAAAIVCAVPR